MEVLLDEAESLEAILMEDVKITRNAVTGIPELIETTVFPVVGEDTDRQYICVTLQVLPTSGYPDVIPTFHLVKPRGLDDSRLNTIKDACVKKLEESIGYPVVFDLIEVIREHLTGSNLPSGQCVVCLYGFREGDEFAKTECYHYLHSYCLARHLIASKKNYKEEQDKLPTWLKKMSDPFQAVCPVCREPIKYDAESLKNALPPLELDNAPDFKLTEQLRELQMKMSNLFLQQKSRGAIIDLRAEENNVISIQTEEQSQFEQRNKATNNEQSDLQTQKIDDAEQEQNETEIGVNYEEYQKKPPTYAHKRSNSSRNQNRSSTVSHQENRVESPSSSSNLKNYDDTAEATNHNPGHYNRRHHRGGKRHHHHHHHNYHQRYHQEPESPKQQQKSTGAGSRAACSSYSR